MFLILEDIFAIAQEGEPPLSVFRQARRLKIHDVGARGVVHMPQFNGKLGGAVCQRPRT